MLGLLREQFNINKYGHDYHKGVKNQIFNVYKKEGGYHLYDLAVFIIIATFLTVFFYTLLIESENGSMGYILVVVSIIGISALLY